MSNHEIVAEVKFEIKSKKRREAEEVYKNLKSQKGKYAETVVWNLEDEVITLQAKVSSEELFCEGLRFWGPMMDSLEQCTSTTKFHIKGALSENTKKALQNLNATYS